MTKMKEKEQNSDDDVEICVGKALEIDNTTDDIVEEHGQKEYDSERGTEIDQDHQEEKDDDEEIFIRYYPVPVRTVPPNNNRVRDSGDRVPGVERIENDDRPSSSSRPPSSLFRRGRERVPIPTAYPVPTEPRDPDVYPGHPINTYERQQPQPQQQQQQRQRDRRICLEGRKCPGILSLVILVTVVLSVDFRRSNQTTGNKNTSDNSSSHPTNATSTEEKIPHKNNTTSTINSTPSSSSFKCFNDPWKIYLMEEFAYRDGVDPSILRTYHVCPNTLIKVQQFDHQFERFIEDEDIKGTTTGFMFFRPNVLVKCGFDGSYENNCTLSGGTHQLSLIPVSLLQTEILVDPGPENITMEGFRFTQAYRGANVFNQASVQSLTLKNCVFDHNYEMFTGIMSAPHYAIESSLNIHNCTFEHNTYKFFRTYKGRYNVGVIASHPVNNTEYAVVNTHISNTTFRNETFLLDDDELVETIPSPVKGNLSPEGMYVNAAIINLVSAWGVLDIADSSFIGNKGYTGSLIIMDKDNRTVLRNSYGNSFVDNESRDSSDADNMSCILLYKNISYDKNGWPIVSEVNKEEEEICSDDSFFV